MASVTLKNAAKQYGKTEVLHDINLQIASGEFIVMVGPSGCGKSTLLRMIAGLETLSEGALEIDGQLVNDVPSSNRGVAMVFQNYALYPHMTVRENLVFALGLVHMDKNEIEQRLQRTAEFLKLSPYLNRLPKALSGGQRQRVAIGRAIIRDPKIFLFDEPLSNLDAALRVATRIKIAQLNDNLPDTTMIYVTHDQVEAMTLADRIVVLSDDGGIEQVGSPLQLYEHPANLFVARFIGSPAMNILPATLTTAGSDTEVRVAEHPSFSVPIPTDISLTGAPIQFGVRPENLHVTESDGWLIEGTLAYLESLGDITQLYIDVGLEETDERAKEDTYLVIKLPGIVNFEVGSTLRLAADLEYVHLFDADGTTLDRRPFDSLATEPRDNSNPVTSNERDTAARTSTLFAEPIEPAL